MEQEHVEEAAGRRGDADRRERIEVHQPHLDVLDAALAQGVERTLAGTDAPLGPDLAVELVLDLQERGRGRAGGGADSRRGGWAAWAGSGRRTRSRSAGARS